MKKIVPLMMIMLFSLCFAAQAEDFDKEHLPKLLGSSNAGTEFFLTFHPSYFNPNVDSIQYKLYVSSTEAAKVSLEVPGKNHFQTKTTIANGVIVFELTPEIALCYEKLLDERPQPEQVFEGAAIHISAEAPIVVYGLIKSQYSGEGYLALPVSGLGKDYIVASWPDPNYKSSEYFSPSFTSVVAPFSDTKARIKIGGNKYTETAGGVKAGETYEFIMNSADVMLIASGSDLTGSKVHSDKPVGVISGSFNAFIPVGVWGPSVLIEMELPTNSWGTTYLVTPIYKRYKNSIIRIFAKEERTHIYRDGNDLGYLRHTGGIRDEGWLEYRAADGDRAPVVISGDKPISVTQYNPGINDENQGVDTEPFQMGLTPFRQYQNEIMFNTPGIKGDHGYDNNFINLVYATTSVGLIPDDLMFAEVVDGEFVWGKLNTIDSIPGVEFKVPVDGKRYFSKTIRLPEDGVYKIKADAPFAAYAYGNSWCDAYGFPACVRLKDNGTLAEEEYTPPETTVRLLPSPVKDLLIIQNTGEPLNTDRISIIDLNGRVIFEEHINVLQGRYEINTSALINGVYILRIHTGERIISEKFTVGR